MQNRDIIKKTAHSLGLRESVVEEVINTDFKIMVDRIKEFNLEDPKTHYIFMLPNFCKFVTNVNKAKKFKDGIEHKSIEKNISL